MHHSVTEVITSGQTTQTAQATIIRQQRIIHGITIHHGQTATTIHGTTPIQITATTIHGQTTAIQITAGQTQAAAETGQAEIPQNKIVKGDFFG